MRNDREENGKFPLHSSTPLKISRDFVELFEGGFEVVNDFLGEYVGLGKIVGLTRLSSLRQETARSASVAVESLIPPQSFPMKRLLTFLFSPRLSHP